MNHANLPDDPSLAEKVVAAQAEADKTRFDRGIVAILLGTKDHVPNNVARIVVIGGFVAIYLMLTAAMPFEQKKDALAIVSGMVTLALGFYLAAYQKTDEKIL